MEASALNHAAPIGMRGPTPLLRLQSDERLIVLVRRGNHAAFEALVARYQSRLLSFCRHMLGSREDAEDVLQEVFAASFNAILADERTINVRPWLYRIARNRSLNHLRRARAVGVDSMDIHVSEGGTTTADKVHKREEFRLLMADVQELPETQKTALLLREIDALSYEQIAEAMETTIPSVKSLLVRARVSLAEAAQARQLTCEDVREELGEVSEGLRRSTAPARRHVRSCERCQGFKSQLRCTNRALAVVFPVAPLLLAKKVLLANLGMTASAGAGSAAGAATAGVAVTGGTSAMTAGISTIATKAAASLAAAAIVTAGAVEVKQVRTKSSPHAAIAAAAPAPVATRTAPGVVAPNGRPVTAADPAEAKSKDDEAAAKARDKEKDKDAAAKGEPDPALTDPAVPVPGRAAAPIVDPAALPLAPVQEEHGSVVVPGAAPRQTGGTVAPVEAPPRTAAAPRSRAAARRSLRRLTAPRTPHRSLPALDESHSVDAAGSGGAAARP